MATRGLSVVCTGFVAVLCGTAVCTAEYVPIPDRVTKLEKAIIELRLLIEKVTLVPGSPGSKGEKGEAGVSGSKGEDGVAGPPGPIGPAGPKGDTGQPGPKGEKGEAGVAGAKGEDGLAGPLGPIGPAGPKGDAGPPGPKGEKGEAGVAGPKGEDGVAGPMGPNGDAGPPGPKGEKGEAGVAGAKGEDGLAGPMGPNGDAGQPGPKGEKGEAGVAGPRGEDGLAGPIGPIGPKGDAGPPGPVGPRGPPGLQGEKGEAGPATATTTLDSFGVVTTDGDRVVILGQDEDSKSGKLRLLQADTKSGVNVDSDSMSWSVRVINKLGNVATFIGAPKSTDHGVVQLFNKFGTSVAFIGAGAKSNSDTTPESGLLVLSNLEHKEAVVLDASNSPKILLNDKSGAEVLRLSATNQGGARIEMSGDSQISLNGKNIRDISEDFEYGGEDSPLPGCLVSVMRTGEGLQLSSNPLDTSVIGVISGAGGLAAGLTMRGLDEHTGQRSVSVSLAGQVYVRVTDENGRVRPGDILVSSSTHGAAMRAPSENVPTGAVVGKVLRAVDRKDQLGNRLVLMLVMNR